MNGPPSASPPSSSVRYQLITTLGKGGMARVRLVLARGQVGVNKLLVVKELLPELKEDAELLAMFLDEARLAVRLNHPNVVQTYEVSTDGEVPLIIMEYLEGQSLAAFLGRVGRAEISLELHLHILTQVLSGLHHAHELRDFDGTPLSVVHRDVSPHNVFLTYDGQVKVVDFGIAKIAGVDGRTRTGVFKGKPNYAAPEQIACGPVDRRADVFAVGVMLWEALARRRIATGGLDVANMQRRLDGADLKIREVAPETPEELALICDRAMATDPQDRYATAEDFRAALAAHLETSKRVGAEALAKLMREVFAVDREKIRQLVDARMKASSTGQSETLTPAWRGDAPSTGTSMRTALAGAQDSSASGAVRAPGGFRAVTTRGGLLLAAGVLCAGAIVATQITRRSTTPAGAPADSAPIASLSTGSPSPPAIPAATVEVSISVTPAVARLFLDDVEVAANPFSGTLPRSPQTRRLRATAPGFVTEERLVVFDRDTQLQVPLKPVAPVRGGMSPPVRTSSPARPVPVEAGASPVGPAAPAVHSAPASPSPGEALTNAPAKQPRQIDDKF